MTETEVVELMENSNSEQEWNDNCNKVKKACGGYPHFWYSAIVESGLVERAAARWGDDGGIKITPIG